MVLKMPLTKSEDGEARADALLDDLRVTPFPEWCKAKGFSYSTGRRLLDSGQGPKITKLTARLLGVQRRHDREWLDRRTKPSTV
jgi:predicted DNA-binding transcriptional regulator AlpA